MDVYTAGEEASEMKAITVSNRSEGVGGMTLGERPAAQAAENDVIVQVHAAGFTPGELEWPSRDGRSSSSLPASSELVGCARSWAIS